LESLTDERVRIAAAPFDHPQLFVPNGHLGTHRRVFPGPWGFAMDDIIEIPMTGAEGGPPLPGFLEGIFGPQSNKWPRFRSLECVPAPMRQGKCS
ncbi:MAG: hypothetical protein NNA22_12590, partial [Nitrospira sp.]|nr:hypothetical protein [Nitrospira sp.]